MHHNMPKHLYFISNGEVQIIMKKADLIIAKLEVYVNISNYLKEK